jgi:hypothetical protein
MTTWIKAILVSLLAFIAPIQPLLIAVGILVGADLITGIIRAFKAGENITSVRMKRTVYKMVVYQVAVLSGFAMELLTPGLLPVAKLVAGVIGLVEIKSVLENVSAVTGTSFKGVLRQLVDGNKGEPKDESK